MEDQRFDRLARRMATTTGRRRLLGAIGALALGTAVRGAAARQPATCTQDSDCADADGDPCTGGVCEGGACTFTSILCAPGFVCCGNGECCPEDAAGAGQCAADVDCPAPGGDPCTGVRCENGTCLAFMLSCAPGFVCCGGACVESCPAGQSLTAECACDGATANEAAREASPGSGNPTAAEGAPAGDNGSGGEAIVAGGDTAAGGTSAAGTPARPVQLPNTGTGGRAGTAVAAWTQPVALLAAAAAFAAHRCRRSME